MSPSQIKTNRGENSLLLPAASSLLDQALYYRERLGWNVVPTKAGAKVPAVKWGQYQTCRPSVQVLRRWFRERKYPGLAVIHGETSGGLAIRDFDCEEVYRRWAITHPDLAAVLPVARARRGPHVYFRTEQECYVSLDDGELRADRCHITLLPPSPHPEGGFYVWERPPNPFLPLPVLDPVSAGLIPPPSPPNQGQQESIKSQDRHMQCLSMGASPQTDRATAEQAVRATLPTGPGQRNRCLFDLARRLKGLPALARAEAGALEPVVRAWWERARPVIRTKEWEPTWKDFTVAWGRVQRPYGATLEGVRWVAHKMVPPVEGEPREERDLLRLEMIAEELQRRHGDRPFPLSCRVAGQLVGVSFQQAAVLIARLRAVGILQLILEADRLRSVAREWRYAGPRLDCPEGGADDVN